MDDDKESCFKVYENVIKKYKIIQKRVKTEAEGSNKEQKRTYLILSCYVILRFTTTIILCTLTTYI